MISLCLWAVCTPKVFIEYTLIIFRLVNIILQVFYILAFLLSAERIELKSPITMVDLSIFPCFVLHFQGRVIRYS